MKIFWEDNVLVNIYIDLIADNLVSGWLMLVISIILQNIKSALEKYLVQKITFRSTIVLCVC